MRSGFLDSLFRRYCLILLEKASPRESGPAELTGTVAIVVTEGGSVILTLASIGNQVTFGTDRMQ